VHSAPTHPFRQGARGRRHHRVPVLESRQPAARDPAMPREWRQRDGDAHARQHNRACGTKLTPGNFDGLVDALRSHTAYGNIHTVQFPAGEIRGEIRRGKRDDGRGKEDDDCSIPRQSANRGRIDVARPRHVRLRLGRARRREKPLAAPGRTTRSSRRGRCARPPDRHREQSADGRLARVRSARLGDDHGPFAFL
jgi:CHRD domain